MPYRTSSEPITIRTSKVAEIDALASAMGRSRNFIVNQAIDQYLVANSWQIDRIKEGLASQQVDTAQEGDEVFTEISDKHGWSP